MVFQTEAAYYLMSCEKGSGDVVIGESESKNRFTAQIEWL